MMRPINKPYLNPFWLIGALTYGSFVLSMVAVLLFKPTVDVRLTVDLSKSTLAHYLAGTEQ